MAGGRHEMNAESLDVVNRIVQSPDFQFAAIAASGIDFTNSE